MKEYRVAQPPPPLPCFGLELDLADKVCQQCPHQPGCIEASRSRADKVPLRHAKVELLLPDGKAIDQVDDLPGYFSMAAERILGQKVTSLTHGQVGLLTDAARELGVDPRLYVVSSLIGHKESSPDRKFYPNHLLGSVAAKRVQLYRRECARRYGLFDAQALEDITYLNTYLPQLQDSEDLAAAYVIGHVLSFRNGWWDGHAIKTGALAALYQTRELALNPAWLATEGTYLNWAKDNPAGTEAIVSHRNLVHASQHHAKEAVSLRKDVVLPAIEKALVRHRVTLDDFYGPPVIQKPAVIWLGLGKALRWVADLEIEKKEETEKLEVEFDE